MMVVRANRIVAVGASAGGIEALQTLVRALPSDFPAPVCVVMHTFPLSPAILDRILSKAGPLPAVVPEDGERIRTGCIYVAPPDRHLLVEPGKLRLTRGPHENRFRPAIDPLFRSVAQVYGPGAIGVLLTGNLDDGTAGLWAVKQLGGVTIVQDPEDASFPGMSRHAMASLKVDHVVPLVEVAPLLIRLAGEPLAPLAERPSVPEHLDIELSIAKERGPLAAGIERVAQRSSYSCPECHGVLLELREGGRVRFRCHRGHAYSIDSLLTGIAEGIERSLLRSVDALDEADLLLRRIAELGESGQTSSYLLQRSDEAKRQAEAIRKMVRETGVVTGREI